MKLNKKKMLKKRKEKKLNIEKLDEGAKSLINVMSDGDFWTRVLLAEELERSEKTISNYL